MSSPLPITLRRFSIAKAKHQAYLSRQVGLKAKSLRAFTAYMVGSKADAVLVGKNIAGLLFWHEHPHAATYQNYASILGFQVFSQWRERGIGKRVLELLGRERSHINSLVDSTQLAAARELGFEIHPRYRLMVRAVPKRSQQLARHLKHQEAFQRRVPVGDDTGLVARLATFDDIPPLVTEHHELQDEIEEDRANEGPLRRSFVEAIDVANVHFALYIVVCDQADIVATAKIFVEPALDLDTGTIREYLYLRRVRIVHDRRKESLLGPIADAAVSLAAKPEVSGIRSIVTKRYDAFGNAGFSKASQQWYVEKRAAGVTRPATTTG